LAIAKSFRSNPTPEEAKAWAYLRDRRTAGWHFRRQQVIEGFIVDFFCAKLRLVIELDGAVHDQPEVLEYDKWRDGILTARGLKVIRVPNDQVLPDRLEAILSGRQSELGVTPPPPRRRGGRGVGHQNPAER
jgi:very-short-patch-repair endonuclease